MKGPTEGTQRPRRQPRAASFDDAVHRSFALAAFITNRHIADHMLRFRRTFKLDFEALVLWAVLAHQNSAHLFPPGALPSRILDEEGWVRGATQETLRPLRMRHLSEITGVPRETTRRKLAALKKAGWILQERQGWVINRAVSSELRDFTLETVRRFLAAANELERALKSVHSESRRSV